MALKVLSNEGLFMEDEAAISQLVKHVFTVKTYCAFQSAKHIYVMQELCRGDLFTFLNHPEKNVLKVKQAAIVLAQMVSAVSYLHDLGIIYRDMKSENILIGSDCYIKLADFGSATFLAKGNYATNFCCTLDYAPPEMIKCSHYVRKDKEDAACYNHMVDWWGLGVLLFEMITGKTLFVINSTHSTHDDDPEYYSKKKCAKIANCTKAPLPDHIEEDRHGWAMQMLEGLLEVNIKSRAKFVGDGASTLFEKPLLNWINRDRLEKKKMEYKQIAFLASLQNSNTSSVESISLDPKYAHRIDFLKDLDPLDIHASDYISDLKFGRIRYVNDEEEENDFISSMLAKKMKNGINCAKKFASEEFFNFPTCCYINQSVPNHNNKLMLSFLKGIFEYDFTKTECKIDHLRKKLTVFDLESLIATMQRAYQGMKLGLALDKLIFPLFGRILTSKCKGKIVILASSDFWGTDLFYSSLEAITQDTIIEDDFSSIVHVKKLVTEFCKILIDRFGKEKVITSPDGTTSAVRSIFSLLNTNKKDTRFKFFLANSNNMIGLLWIVSELQMPAYQVKSVFQSGNKEYQWNSFGSASTLLKYLPILHCLTGFMVGLPMYRIGKTKIINNLIDNKPPILQEFMEKGASNSNMKSLHHAYTSAVTLAYKKENETVIDKRISHPTLSNIRACLLEYHLTQKQTPGVELQEMLRLMPPTQQTLDTYFEEAIYYFYRMYECPGLTSWSSERNFIRDPQNLTAIQNEMHPNWRRIREENLERKKMSCFQRCCRKLYIICKCIRICPKRPK
ncbi:hypothetical protein Ciccas_008593 [Cichlidogyrus casuarinus]|uniref:Protein kinase domain-containing protein n=1 Tax=Cichlidogyrus casuarinus TaxID=1844966 RepID=A0ABD2Q0D1_9PLAT